MKAWTHIASLCLSLWLVYINVRFHNVGCLCLQTQSLWLLSFYFLCCVIELPDLGTAVPLVIIFSMYTVVCCVYVKWRGKRIRMLCYQVRKHQKWRSFWWFIGWEFRIEKRKRSMRGLGTWSYFCGTFWLLSDNGMWVPFLRHVGESEPNTSIFWKG